MVASRNEKSSKRQLIGDALAAATEGRWEDALAINEELLDRFPRDAETLNRKGRALIELRQLNAARDAYSEALKADPANMIARRNLQRLEMLYNRPDGSLEGATTSPTTLPRSNVFVEEIGKTWVDELANPTDLTHLAEVSPGEQLQIKVEGEKVFILSDDGLTLGEVGAPVSQRLAQLIGGGNRYEVYALGISSQSLRVIIREVFKHPSLSTEISFKEQVRKTQDLMRERELLSMREEGDFVFGDDDEVELDDEVVDDDHEEDDDRDADAEAYVDKSVAQDDDDEQDAM